MAKQIVLHQYETEIGGVKITTNAKIVRETPKAYFIRQSTQFGPGDAADNLLKKLQYEAGGVNFAKRTYQHEDWLPASATCYVEDEGKIIALECEEWITKEKWFMYLNDVH